MLTDDKKISSPDYWNELFSGKRNNAKIDSSNGVRTSTFDRFTIVADLVEGTRVLEVAAGHARISSIVRSRHPNWVVIASDQSVEAMKVSNYSPYIKASVYELPFSDKGIQTVICTQAWEYFEYLEMALKELKRIANKGVFTFPKGEMSNWSQLYIFTPNSVKDLLKPYGTIENFQEFDHLILVKIKFL